MSEDSGSRGQGPGEIRWRAKGPGVVHGLRGGVVVAHLIRGRLTRVWSVVLPERLDVHVGDAFRRCEGKRLAEVMLGLGVPGIDGRSRFRFRRLPSFVEIVEGTERQTSRLVLGRTLTTELPAKPAPVFPFGVTEGLAE